MNVSLADLESVKGIGKKTIERIKSDLIGDNIPTGEFLGKDFELKKNELYNGDSIKLLNRINDNSVDLIVTDPPYKTTSRGCAGNSGGMLQKDINKKGQVFDDNNLTIEDWIHQLYRVLKPTGHCYIMTNHKNLYKYLKSTREAGFKFIKNIIWDKGNKIMGQYYMSQYEYILFLRKGAGKMINNCSTPDILSISNKKHKFDNGGNWHDTEKPVDLMNILIKNSSQEGDVVLDPFMGVGAVPLSATKNNRKYIGIEINNGYYEIAKKRLQ
jgi:site-specific DNA-methyltransferase (adenine-specific)